jgi:DNA-binding transcriptional ArsR family regulator
VRGPVGDCSVALALRFVSAYGDGGLGLLGDPMRRAIFERLAQRPSSVGELAEHLPISRPAVSQHLKALKDGGLVVSHAEGTRRIYRLDPHGVAALRSWLEGVWAHALADFHKFAEQAVADETAAADHPGTHTTDRPTRGTP